MNKTMKLRLLSALVSILVPGLARAQQQPPTPPDLDPLTPTGIALSTASVAAIVGGLALRQSGIDGGAGEYCGFDGCFERPNHNRRVGGAALLGGGIGAALIAAPVTVAGLWDDPRGPRQSEVGMTFGVVTTAAGLSLASGGIAAMIEEASRPQGDTFPSADVAAYDMRSEATVPAVASLIGGGALLAVGIPLWAWGGSDWEPEQETELRERPDGTVESVSMVTIDNSPTMRNVGIGLTAGGLGTAGVGVAVGLSMAGREGDLSGLGGAVIGGAVVGTGTLLCLIGVPLWIAGEHDIEVPDSDPRAREQLARRAVPRVAVGPTGFDLSWRF